MALIKVELSAPPVDGMDIKFKAPCDCTAVTGMLAVFPSESGSIEEKEFTFRDAHGHNLAGIGNLFGAGAYVKVIIDTARGYAYLQNADTNGFLNTAILGTYTHDVGSLTGRGDNGKFKATYSGTISTINVNGRACSVRCGEDTSMDLVAGCWYTFILDGDTVNFSSGGAGAGLNFKVVGGTAFPASPSENTIWINTDSEITGYMFSATEPKNPSEGMVWITTGAFSLVAFSLTKKNPIMVYPLASYQRIGGEWVIVEGRIYQGGLWVELYADIMVYDDGATGIKLELTRAVDSGSYLTMNLGANSDATARTELLDISRQTTLEIVYSDLTGGGSFAGGIQAQVWDENGQVVAQTARNTAASGTLSLDVSALSGSHRVGVYANNTSGSYAGSCRVKSIKVLMGSDVATLAAKAEAYDILMEGVSE